MDTALARLFTANAQWASAVNSAEPGFFEASAKGQSPKILWFGCSDSRVPESVLTASKPGDIFVHRNIANQFHLHDDSALSVLTYAVDHVGVDHVVVVGHTQCGGAAACHQSALAGAAFAPGTPLGRWLEPLTELAASLDPHNASSTEDALNQLVEANVRQQVDNVVASSTIQNAWATGQKKVWVHGFVYNLKDGLLKDLGVSRGAPA
ncbi:carbonic anhydrase [Auriscalpium vulgare]|uniref:Carbonic anhydrase n=2 Tax=Auriscalpium vulgare TaxID=40419 RepID=A0ACB8S6E3_9AGAM|nr:carbonic anhydrase [Auriscalpium vulgare]KAI0051626.1 carbonic anhydrase [Auriscalpium vulgare]